MKNARVSKASRSVGNKFFLSKWTAVVPRNREKHFLAKGAIRKNPTTYICALEAVRTKRIIEIDWRELKDGRLWLSGWR